MLDFILCPTCGEPIGSMYKAFHDIKTERYRIELAKKKSEMDITNVNVIDYIQLPMNDVFEDLNINKMCCRMRMTTAFTFHDAANM